MEDKMFEFMTKMYAEMTNRFDAIDKKLDSKADKNDIVRIENKLDNTTKALFDGYNQVCDKVVAVENAVTVIEKVSKHQKIQKFF